MMTNCQYVTCGAWNQVVESVKRSTWPSCSFWVQTQNILQWIYIYFLSIFFSNCGFSCLLAPPVHLPFIMQLFWTWSQIFRVILATPPLPTHTHHPYLAGDTWRRIFQETKLQQAGEGCGCLKGPRMNWEGGDRGDLGWTEPTPRGYCKNKAIWLHL